MSTAVPRPTKTGGVSPERSQAPWSTSLQSTVGVSRFYPLQKLGGGGVKAKVSQLKQDPFGTIGPDACCTAGQSRDMDGLDASLKPPRTEPHLYRQDMRHVPFIAPFVRGFRPSQQGPDECRKAPAALRSPVSVTHNSLAVICHPPSALALRDTILGHLGLSPVGSTGRPVQFGFVSVSNQNSTKQAPVFAQAAAPAASSSAFPTRNSKTERRSIYQPHLSNPSQLVPSNRVT